MRFRAACVSNALCEYCIQSTVHCQPKTIYFYLLDNSFKLVFVASQEALLAINNPQAERLKVTMARPTIIQSAPLREQIYDAIRLELRTGEIGAGGRLLEVELAKKYGVSRTPVREALFQLARDGLIISGERGFMLPTDTSKSLADRLEAHLLIDPRVARHAASEGTADELKTLFKALEKGQQSHQSNRFNSFVEANYQFRITWRKMCRNEPLTRCATMLEDQFLAARNDFYKDPTNRALALFHDEKLLVALEARDGDAAGKATREYMTALIEKFVDPRQKEMSKTPSTADAVTT